MSLTWPNYITRNEVIKNRGEHTQLDQTQNDDESSKCFDYFITQIHFLFHGLYIYLGSLSDFKKIGLKSDLFLRKNSMNA